MPDDNPYTLTHYAGVGSAAAFAARAFNMVLHALGSSGATLGNLEVLLRSKAHGLPDYAFHVPEYSKPTVAPFLGKLNSLLLAVDLHWMAAQGAAENAMESTSGCGCALKKFLLLAPNVTHLRLNFQDGSPHENLAWFLEWLATPDPDLNSQLLPKLAKLDLGRMRAVEPNLLYRLVGRWGSTLTGVTFWKISIRNSDEQAAAALGLDGQSKPNLWRNLLVQLPKVAPSLNRISVGCLAQLSRAYQQFRITPNVHNPRAVRREYGREEMRDPEKFKALLDNELRVEPPYGLSGAESENELDGECYLQGCPLESSPR
jgi:hypothetical protein